MAVEEAFVAFSEEKIDLRVGEMLMQFFYKGGGEDHVTDEGCLYDQEFLHWQMYWFLRAGR